MINLRDGLTQYVTLRRALGTKLQEPAITLGRFLDFLEGEKAEFITSELALRWAMQPHGVQRATWARRLGMVRGFAACFTEQEIRRLMAQAGQLASPTRLRALTYTTLIGLLTATGLRRWTDPRSI